ncbi:MAG: M23 family metallopeptidase [Gemmatimonadota bacterium]
MARREWTVVIVSDDGAGVRQFRMSRELARVCAALGLLLIAVLASLATAFLIGAGAGRADARLVSKNRLLERELREIVTLSDTLQLSLESLGSKDEYYRLLAGLDPLDEDVRRAGIGGPDGNGLEESPLYLVDRSVGRLAHATSADLNTLVRRARVLSQSWGEARETLAGTYARLSATPSIFPTMGYVSSSFSASRWHPILNRPRPHAGIDIVAPRGTPVVASANGRVRTASRQGDFGLMVEIDHGFGVVTRYAHLSRVGVRVGERVERGGPIGNVGDTGLAVGPHLHYEVLVNGRAANPRSFILDMNAIPD